MIAYVRVSMMFYPHFVCDACLTPIERSGNVYWLVNERMEVRPGLWHTHKGPCARYDRVLESESPGTMVMSEELTAHLDHLRYNLNEPGDLASKLGVWVK